MSNPYNSLLLRLRSPLVIAAAALYLTSCAAPESPTDELLEPAASAVTADDTSSDTASRSPLDDAAPPAALSATTPLTEVGWGPIRIGMTRAEVVRAAGEDANPGAVGGPEPEQCDEFRPERAPDGMRVMVEQGRLTRITVSDGSSTRTEQGFGVGDPAGPIRAAYGADAVTTPHKYVAAPAAYITVWTTPPPGPDARGLVYEIGADGRVMHIHAGGPSIQYVEGCL